jgi:N-methylhydantoinase A
VAFEGRETLVELDMSYLGQTHTVAVPLAVRDAAGDSLGITRDAIRTAFEARYREVYGRVLERLPVRVLNLRVTTVGKRPKFDLSILAPGAEASMAAADRGSRPVYVEGAWHDARIWDRPALPVGAVVPGPAVLEQSDATIFVEPDLQARVDAFGNLLVSRKEAS